MPSTNRDDREVERDFTLEEANAAVEQLRPLVELGVSHVMISPSSLRTLERFSAEVAPEVARIPSPVGGRSSA